MSLGQLKLRLPGGSRSTLCRISHLWSVLYILNSLLIITDLKAFGAHPEHNVLSNGWPESEIFYLRFFLARTGSPSLIGHGASALSNAYYIPVSTSRLQATLKQKLIPYLRYIFNPKLCILLGLISPFICSSRHGSDLLVGSSHTNSPLSSPATSMDLASTTLSHERNCHSRSASFRKPSRKPRQDKRRSRYLWWQVTHAHYLIFFKLILNVLLCAYSVAGLMTARVCHDHFERVLIIEPEAWLFTDDGMPTQAWTQKNKRTRVMQYRSAQGRPVVLRACPLLTYFDQVQSKLWASLVSKSSSQALRKSARLPTYGELCSYHFASTTSFNILGKKKEFYLQIRSRE